MRAALAGPQLENAARSNNQFEAAEVFQTALYRENPERYPLMGRKPQPAAFTAVEEIRSNRDAPPVGGEYLKVLRVLERAHERMPEVFSPESQTVEVQPQDVRDFLSERLDSGLGARTVKHLRNTLRAALNQAINDDLIQRNVAAKVKPPEIQPRALDVYTPEEAGVLIEAAKAHRLKALFTAAVALGLRMGEAARYGLYDLDRLERMILRRVAREYFLLDDGKEPHDD